MRAVGGGSAARPRHPGTRLRRAERQPSVMTAAATTMRANSRPFVLILLAVLFCAVPFRALISAEHPGVTHTLLFKGKVPGTDEQIIVWDTEYLRGAVNPRHLHPAAVTF